jgi:hypothetical protein
LACLQTMISRPGPIRRLNLSFCCNLLSANDSHLHPSSRAVVLSRVFALSRSMVRKTPGPVVIIARSYIADWKELAKWGVHGFGHRDEDKDFQNIRLVGRARDFLNDNPLWVPC